MGGCGFLDGLAVGLRVENEFVEVEVEEGGACGGDGEGGTKVARVEYSRGCVIHFEFDDRRLIKM